MNKKFLYFFICLFIVSLALFILQISSIKKNMSPQPTGPSLKTTTQKGGDLEPVNPETLKEPTFNTTKSLQIGDVTFEPEVTISDATISNSFPTLLQASSKYLLFKTISGLYLYDLSSHSKIIIDKDVSIATLSDDDSFVFYAKPNIEKTAFDIYKYDTKSKYGYVVYTTTDVKVSSLSYGNGAIFYSYHPDNNDNPITTELFVLPEFQDKYSAPQQKMTINNSSSIFTYHKNRFYTYTPSTKTIDWVQLGSQNQPFYKTNITTNGTVSNLEFNDNEDWLLVYNQDVKPYSEIITSKGIIPSTSPTEATWLDNSHLLFIDHSMFNFIAYIYNVDTQQKTVLKSDVVNIKAYKGTIYILCEDGNVIMLKEKQGN